jgi:jasmonate O-methyltransferase
MQVKTILEENMILMVSNKTNNYCWKVADLGCSSGPNTLMVISNIMNIINKITLKLNHVITPTFQIYLNDLFENDFNTIFKLLPDFYQQIKEENVGECFINATPGNFYGRLFPNNYINFFHSSYCLHWLSQVSIHNKTNLICMNHLIIYEVSVYGIVFVYGIRPRKIWPRMRNHLTRETFISQKQVLHQFMKHILSNLKEISSIFSSHDLRN